MMIAHATINRAKQKPREERDRELAGELQKVRADLKEARATYLRLTGQIKQQSEARAQIQVEINRLIDAISQSWTGRPRVADILPDDPEVVAWRARHQSLERERDRLIERRNAIPQISIVEVVRLNDPVMGVIPQLERSEANLVAQLDHATIRAAGEAPVRF
jgi:hypothetical protein